MDLIDRLNEIAARIPKQIEHLKTEEATKNALVMPFIQALGYDVFNPAELIPEFTADVGTKKGEKVDYAIMKDGSPIILVECKCVGTTLDLSKASQLYRYFSVTSARFAILTDGLQYKIFSDLEDRNKMDSRPFLEFSITDVTSSIASELKKFSRDSFDLDDILSTASDLKYTKGIQRVLGEEYINPTEEMVRLLSKRVYSGMFTQSVKDQFTDIVKRAFHQFVNSRLNERLKTALESTHERDTGTDTNTQTEDTPVATSDDGVVTTEEEIEGFHIVKAIVREVVDAKRIFMRDTQSYCGILVDDNNRKPICRLRFNFAQKYIGVFDEQKNETKNAIESLDDIYNFADQLKQTAIRHA